MKKIFAILIFSLVLSLPLAAFAIPPFPMNFIGTVTINAVSAPVGSVIKVYGDLVGDDVSTDVLLAQFTLTTAGTYGGARILAESAKLSVPEYSGSSLTFKINSPQYNSNAQSSSWTPSSIGTYSLAFSEFLGVTKNLAFTGATPTAVVSIAVTPATFSIVAGATKQFTATGTYTDATTADITSSATWTSGTTATATIGSTTGLATGVAYGTSIITATYVDATNGTLTGTATLTVSASIPSGLSATAVSSSQINLSWTAVTGAASYKVYRGGSNISSPTSNSYSNTGLTASTAYSYTVSAVNADGETSQCSAVSATTEAAAGGSAFVSGGTGGGAPTTPTAVPAMPTTTTGQVTATALAGGQTTVTTAENAQVTVKLPIQAVASSTQVVVTSVAATESAVSTAVAAIPSAKGMAGSYVYNFTATSAGQSITTFLKYVTITMTYTDAQIKGLKESTLAVNYWDAVNSKWIPLATTVSKITNTLTSQTLHFTYLAILGEKGVEAEMTIAELKTQIAQILALINQLQARLTALLGGVQSFAADLSSGMKANSEVKRLQEFLISKGYLAAGLNTGNYFSKTVGAVKAYQTAKGIAPAAGYFGPKTRAAVNTDL